MRYYQRQEAKCNLCLYWFPLPSQSKGCTNFCQDCISKALNTRCFKVAAADSTIYQMHLIQKYSKMEKYQSEKLQIKNQIYEEVDTCLQKQITSLTSKWKKFINFISQDKEIKESDLQKIKNMFVEYSEKRQQRELDSTNKLQVKITNLNKKNFQAEIINDFQLLPTPQKQQIMRTPLKDNTSKMVNRSSQSRYKSRGSSIKKEAFSKENEIFTTGKLKKSIFLHEQNILPASMKIDTKFQTKKLDSLAKISSFSLHSSKVNKNSVKLEKSEVNQREQMQIKQRQQKMMISAFLERSKTPTVMQKIQTQKVFESILNTNNINNCLELVSYKLEDINFLAYLENLKWDNIEVLKLIKVGLTDEQFKILTQFIKGKNIETLVVTNNNLTEESISTLKGYQSQTLKNVYIGNNQILNLKVKSQLKNLKEKYCIHI